MTGAAQPASGIASLDAAVRSAFGTDRFLMGVDRLRGGTKKGVYRVTLDDGSAVVAYVWAPIESLWVKADEGRTPDLSDPFADASSIEMFMASYERLTHLGVRTPRLVSADGSRSVFPAEIAFVEHIPGGSLETLMTRNPEHATVVVAQLRAEVEKLHSDRSPKAGKVAAVAQGRGLERTSADGLVLQRALSDLAEAAARVDSIVRMRRPINELLHQLAAAAASSSSYALIHGELGPDHVLIDDAGRPVIIDIDGAAYFDIEWEHAFARMRFGQEAWPLGATGLDEHRMRFYTLALHLSLVAGPLRFLDGHTSGHDEMREIAYAHTEKVLAIASGQTHGQRNNAASPLPPGDRVRAVSGG